MTAQPKPTATHPEGPPLKPTTEHERIAALDVLRGFALLGILVMNIQSLSMIQSAYINPTAYGDLTGANYWVWVLGHVLTDQKMMTIFSMLFGVGIALMASRAEARGERPARMHYRRMFWLIGFGLLHGYLLWYGDILFLYGVCGLVVFLFRKLTPRKLLVLGVLVISLSSAIYLFFGWSMQFWPSEALAEFKNETWQPPPERVAWEVAAYQGGWLEQMAHRVPSTLQFETFLLLIWGFWRASGLMLVGMGLYKLGVFTVKGPRLYLAFIAAGVLVGIPVVLYGVQHNFATGWGPKSLFYGSQYNYWGSLLVSLAWVGVVMLVCQRPSLAAVTRPFAAVGRMAFSNYILHTVICTSIFYGHGLGLFGQVERTGQITIVGGVWVLQLIVSPLWLRYFRFGPLEWLWRSLTYRKLQPFRRSLLPVTA